MPVIPLYQVPNVLAYRTTIRNVIRSPDNLFWNVEDWWLDASLQVRLSLPPIPTLSARRIPQRPRQVWCGAACGG